MAGRENKYLINVQPRLDSIRAWRRLGMIEQQIADNLQVARSSLSLYKTQHPELVKALRTGKKDADAHVENALFKLAMGYEYEETERTAVKTGDDKKEKQVRIKRVTRQVIPNVTAQIFYLKNRASSRWRDRYGHEHTGADGEPLRPSVVVYLPEKNKTRLEPDQAAENGKAVNRLISSKGNGGSEDNE